MQISRASSEVLGSPARTTTDTQAHLTDRATLSLPDGSRHDSSDSSEVMGLNLDQAYQAGFVRQSYMLGLVRPLRLVADIQQTDTESSSRPPAARRGQHTPHQALRIVRVTHPVSMRTRSTMRRLRRLKSPRMGLPLNRRPVQRYRTITPLWRPLVSCKRRVPLGTTLQTRGSTELLGSSHVLSIVPRALSSPHRRGSSLSPF